MSAPTAAAARLGCYVLPGGVSDPRPVIDQARAAERLGLGTVWIGERYDTKDLPSLAGALTQTTQQIRIAAGITHPGLRHPMVLASMGQTLQALSGGRFGLGFGRSADWRWRAYGAAPPTLTSLRDIAAILRRLWAGEPVSYDGPLGRFPDLRLPQRPSVDPPPLLLAAVGPKTAELAGRCFDGIILHPFLTPDGVARSADLARSACRQAGRDPGAFRCYATVVVASEMSAGEERRALAARAAGYFQVSGLGDALVRANGWDPSDLARYRSQPELVALGGKPADKLLGRDELARLARAFPAGWLPSSVAVGAASECAARLQEYLDSGADELILHGSTAEHLGPVVAALSTFSSPGLPSAREP